MENGTKNQKGKIPVKAASGSREARAKSSGLPALNMTPKIKRTETGKAIPTVVQKMTPRPGVCRGR